MKLMQKVFSTFEKPSGFLGYLAGKIMAARGSNLDRNRWGTSLLDLTADHRVLEFGCGPGPALEFLLPPGGQVVALDHSEQMIRMAAARYAVALRSERLQLLVTDVFAYAEGYSGEGFDRIYSSNVVQFWPDLKSGFAAVKSLLRPGGRIVTNYMSRGSKPSSEDSRSMAERIATAKRAAGFSSVRIEYLDLKPIIAASVVAEVGGMTGGKG